MAKKKKKRNLIGRWPLSVVMCEDKQIVLEHNNITYKINNDKLRLQNFRSNGWKCKGCGRKATCVKITCTGEAIHLDLYDDNNLLFTHDHIKPTSRGGANTIENSQTLCEKCNSIKSNKLYNFQEPLKIICKETGKIYSGIVVGMTSRSVTLEQILEIPN